MAAGTESKTLREKGNKVYLSISEDLAPVIQEERNKKALQLYHQALSCATNIEDKVSALKNVGMASYQMYLYQDDHGTNQKEVEFYLAEAMGYLSSALEAGVTRSLDWRHFVNSKVMICVEKTLKILHDLSLESRAEQMPKMIQKIPKSCKGEVNLELADCLFKCAVMKQDERDYKKCLHYLHECYQPLEEAKVLCGDEQKNEASILEVAIFHQKCVAESRKAIKTGDDLLNIVLREEESLNMDMVFDILDWYQQAIILSRELEMEVEAIASSRLGYVYDKILVMKVPAKERFLHTLQLANILKPRVFTDCDWFMTATETIERYQQEFQKAEEEKWEHKRKQYMEENKEELKELNDFLENKATFVEAEDNGKDVRETLEFVYKRFPPKNPEWKMEPIIAKADDGDRDKLVASFKKAYQKAVTHYHPDRQKEEDGLKWKVLAEEICKILTQRYERMK